MLSEDIKDVDCKIKKRKSRLTGQDFVAHKDHHTLTTSPCSITSGISLRSWDNRRVEIP